MRSPATTLVVPVSRPHSVPSASLSDHGTPAAGSPLSSFARDWGSGLVRRSFVTDDHGDSAQMTNTLVPVSLEKHGSRMKLPRKQRHASGLASATEPSQQYPLPSLVTVTPLATPPSLNGEKMC